MYQEMVNPIVKDTSIPPLARIEKILCHFISLFRELNQGVEWIFSNDALKIQKVRDGYLEK